ncbi:hypothetical protein AGMMS49942_21200 [Spirochaetia bacterium]|nr:hypothetical protein AGMMS49942_21200 [Spirochaetia bacterium]
MVRSVKSQLISLENIVDSKQKFNIPRYQRLFVWKNVQIDTLLEDLKDAYISKKELYYLGGIIVVKSRKGYYDLIDGQQRFTTLWLLSYALKDYCLKKFLKVNNELRLSFSIRKQVSDYFNKLFAGEEIQDNEIDDTEKSLSKITKWQGRIKNFILENENLLDMNKFSQFIYEKLYVLITEVSETTDLNKLFEVTNNRGMQLQHHEILKSTILKFIENKQERIRYSKIWDSCSNMEDYIERNISYETGLKSSEISECYNKHSRSFDFKSLLHLMINQGRNLQINDADILSILKLPKKYVEGIEEVKVEDLLDNPDEGKNDQDSIRSILTFPQLLLHTLRIYLYKKNLPDINKISEKELLHTFKKHCNIENGEAAKEYIELLFNVRFTFDQFIIKWIKIDKNEEKHEIRYLTKYNQSRKQTYYFKRTENEEDGFALLQSMLYHSQQITTHYWLTPILFSALEDKDRDSLFEKLRLYDNILFCTKNESTLQERTLLLMDSIANGSFGQYVYNYDIIDENLGVSFPHYWFYKLEFILWYLLSDEILDWKKFRMTAKNSVEHVSPQNPNYTQDIVSKRYLNTFGNLALVSRNINSEFSNKPFREKREHFLYAKRSDRVDSLKLDIIYRNKTWSDDLCKDHLLKMKGYIEEYFRLE